MSASRPGLSHGARLLDAAVSSHDVTEFVNQPEMRVRMREAILARAAIDVDETSDVLLVGRDFSCLAQDRAGGLVKVGIGNERVGAPTRIVIDANSFLAGMVDPAQRDESSPAPLSELIAIHETNGRLFRVQFEPISPS